MAPLSYESLRPEQLKSTAGQESADLGEKLYKQGHAQVVTVTEDSAECRVQDNRRAYPVRFQIEGKFLYIGCSCAYGMRGLLCEHGVAAALALGDYLRANKPSNWRSQLNRVLKLPVAGSQPRNVAGYHLFFTLELGGEFRSSVISPRTLLLSALPKELRSQPNLLTAAELPNVLEKYPHLLNLSRTPRSQLNLSGAQNASGELVALANLITERSRSYYSYSYNQQPVAAGYLETISRNHGALFLSEQGAIEPYPLEISTEIGQLHLKLARQDDKVSLLFSILLGARRLQLSEDDLDMVSQNPTWVLYENTLLRLSDEADAFLNNIGWLPEIVITPKEMTEFLDEYYLPLAQKVRLESDFSQWETIEAAPAPRLYLTETKGELQAQLRFGYGDLEVEAAVNPPEEIIQRKPDSWDLLRIRRQPEAEANWTRTLNSSTYGLKRLPMAAQPGLYSLRARTNPVEFLLHTIPRLTADGFAVYGEERLKLARVNRNKPSLSFSVSSGIDWFDVNVSVQFGEQNVSLKDLRRLVRKRERYIKLADGTIGEIPAEWIERYRRLFDLSGEGENGLRLANHHVTLLDQLLGEAERVQADAEFERRRQQLHNFSGIQARPLPAGFVGELRPYQHSGYEWLHFLNDYGFGGCLADDMGLGKTVQVLVFLQSLYEDHSQNRPASLVVAPRSLLVNWQREAARFTPSLRVREHFDSQRLQDPSGFDGVDLVITTYGVMLRDVQMLSKYRFQHLILDESQAIKNPLAQTTKAARLMNAHRRLVLTGTPVENSTMELWSQFAFLNPGLLGSLDYFKSEFAGPIERKRDEEAANFLRKMVFPFILRRTKDQVAPELPPRSERILYCDMEPAQRRLYLRTRDQYRSLLMGMISEEGMNTARFKVLEGLLRLRQISNHPRLVDELFHGESGKFNLLIEHLETLQAEGHKALVFSQFVQMLTLVRQALDERGMPYEYLDGQTQNRQERVDHFQADPGIPFFLISLKAGGQGLNLTAADYVIHIDPWWNPAVEMQATDRTHRIGQDKPVFVYKLIARDSVEEKILLLQDRKRALVDQLIATESSFFKELTAEDVKVLFS